MKILTCAYLLEAELERRCLIVHTRPFRNAHSYIFSKIKINPNLGGFWNFLSRRVVDCECSQSLELLESLLTTHILIDSWAHAPTSTRVKENHKSQICFFLVSNRKKTSGELNLHISDSCFILKFFDSMVGISSSSICMWMNMSVWK